MKTIQVNVTAADIKAGIPDNCHWCPVARAVARAAGVTTTHVSVGSESIEFDRCKPLETATTPDEVFDFMNDFDGIGPEGVEPFSFELQIYETADIDSE